MQSDDDFITINGVITPVDRSEHSKAIDRTAKDLKLSHEEAWQIVRAHLAELPLVESPNGSTGKKQTGKQVASGATSPALPSSKSSQRKPHVPPSVSHEGLRPVLHLNGAGLDALNHLSADVLEALRLKPGASVIEALSAGMLRLADEDPDAQLLRSVTPELMAYPQLLTPDQRNAVDVIQQKQYRFPFGEAGRRIMPTDLNKTSLFHVGSNNSPRRMCRGELLGRIGGVTALYWGEELRHDDEQVFMQLIHVANGRYPYEQFEISNLPFFRGTRNGVSRVLSGKDTDNVLNCLHRLRGGHLALYGQRKSYVTLNLIAGLGGLESNHEVWLDPLIVLLFSSFTSMDSTQLFATRGIARQLLKYLSTIPENVPQVHPIKVMSLFELCYGTLETIERHYREINPSKSDSAVGIAMSKKLSDFRRKNLPAGLAVVKNLGIISSYEIDEATDKVVVKRDSDESANRNGAGE